MAYLSLQPAMGDILLMQYLQTPQELFRDFFGRILDHGSVLSHILIQTTVRGILHRDVYCILILKPAEK